MFGWIGTSGQTEINFQLIAKQGRVGCKMK